ncbi:MAG: asparaginase [Chloroflexi bacterium]|nr:asparaginase [Chloroflexota bacterium]
MQGSTLPRVRIVSTGGTIANTPTGRLTIDQVLSDIARWHPTADPRQIADITVTEVLREGAETFTPAEWVTIARGVTSAIEQLDVDAVIVTHGTFTAEETAYFLHLTVRSPKPVVVVCSQRKHSTIGNDGDKNLLDAIRVAVDPAARGRGVLLLLNEEIHSAREVTKTNQRPSGFVSGLLGLLGSVEADQVSFYRQPTRRHTTSSELTVPADGNLPRVDVVATYAGADGVAVRAFVEAGAKGIVVNGFSYSGKPHQNQVAALHEAVERGVPVVLVNRGGGGRAPNEPDGQDEFVRGDNLSAQKARVLLSLALTRTTNLAELRRIFGEY